MEIVRYVQDGQVRPAQAGLWFSETADVASALTELVCVTGPVSVAGSNAWAAGSPSVLAVAA